MRRIQELVDGSLMLVTARLDRLRQRRDAKTAHEGLTLKEAAVSGIAHR
jgi:hypothetical protein